MTHLESRNRINAEAIVTIEKEMEAVINPKRGVELMPNKMKQTKKLWYFLQ